MAVSLRDRDPDRVALWRGLRVAVVVPGLYAFGLFVVDNPELATFAEFGSLAMLGFADFEGEPGVRVKAYGLLTLAGILAICFGTAAALHPVAAGLVAGSVVAAVTFVGVLGGNVTAAVTPLVMLTVLSATLDPSLPRLGQRLAGLLLAGTASAVACLFPWHPPRRHQREAAAEVCRSLSHSRADPPGDAGLREQQGAQVVAIRDALHRMPPADPERDVAFLYALDDLAHVVAVGPAPPLPAGPAVPVAAHLAAVDADTLGHVADALDGTGGVPPARPITEARAEMLGELGESTRRALESGERIDTVLDSLDATFPLRLRTMLVAALAAHTAALVDPGSDPAAYGFARTGMPRGRAHRVVEHLSAHLDIASTGMRNALRSGLAVGIAVVIATQFGVAHAAWVGLGALSVLRSAALSTGFTAAQALAGTAIGAVVGATFFLTAGETQAALWISLPILLFLSVYTPTTFHYVAGQAAFSAAVVPLYNIVDPEGMVSGLIRLEDVAIGAGVAMLLGLFLWPRGAGAQLRETLAGLLSREAAYLSAAGSEVLGTSTNDTTVAQHAAAAAAWRRAEYALMEFLSERGHGKVPIAPWTELLTLSVFMRNVSDGIATIAGSEDRTTGADRDGADVALAASLGEIAAAVRTLAAGVEGDPNAAPSLPEFDRRHRDDALHDRLDEVRSGSQGVHAALELVWLQQWLEHAAWITDQMREPTALLATEPKRPWWT